MADRLRILYVIQGILPTGPGRHLFKLLAYRNHDTVDAQVFAYDRCDSEMMGILEREHGVRWQALGQRFADPRVHVRGWPRLTAQIAAFRPHVIQTHHTPVVDWSARLATVRMGVPVNLSRAVGQPKYYHLSRQGRLAWWYTRLGDRTTSRVVDYYLPNSDDVARYMQEIEGVPPEKIVTIPNGVDTDLFTAAPDLRAAGRAMLGVPEGVPLIAYVAAIKTQKQQHLLIDAVLGLLGDFPDLHLALVGKAWSADDERYRDGLDATLAKAGRADRVHFTGELHDVRPILAAADVYAHPSAYEGSSNALLEAMAMGRPSVVSDITGSPELVGEGQCGTVVPRADGVALREALRQMLSDSGGRQRMALAARERAVTGYSARTMCQRIEELSRRALAAKGVRLD